MDEQKLLKRRKKALNENNEALLISVCTDLANLYSDQGKHDFAIEEYTIVANIYKQQKKQLNYGIVNRGIGEAYLGLEKFDKAVHHLEIYLNISRELKNKLEEQRALATIGHIYLSSYLNLPGPENKDKLTLANKFLMKSLVVSQTLNGQISKVELADMSARLFSNLGVVQDCLENFDKALELLNKSIVLCRSNDLFEQLQRGYLSLASVFMKKGDRRSALQQYNLAAEAASKLRDKPILLADILINKSELLIKLGDFCAAKSALLKAYRLKIPDLNDRRVIENKLRVVASMSSNEDKLIMTEDTDYKTLKTLYEKMGDGACVLKMFDRAADYYKKMLDSAEKANLMESELATCYYSLAETYKDNKQYKEAIVYFEKELSLCRSFKDSLNTFWKIAETRELADDPISEVQAVYTRALERCQREGDVHEEGKMLKRFILYLRRQKQHSEAFQLEQSLAKLNYQSSESDSDSSDAPTTSIVGGDIDLDALTDVSDESDSEPPTKTRRRTKSYTVKRNTKGETQLHTACIKGQLNVVHHLLELGHPVNVRDNCGWLPLHEACNYGHVDIVKLLLDKGAAINDRGGTQCQGVTPLHDAAFNGHLSVMQLLLDRGANAFAKTDTGETILEYLKVWRSKVQLDFESEHVYESLVEQMSQALDKAGAASITNDSHEQTVKLSSPTKDLRRSALVGLEDEDNSSPPLDHAFDYRSVMLGLRRKSDGKSKISPKTGVSKRSALVSAEDMVDDWLEDDVGKSYKKRKSNSPAKSHSSRKSTEEVVTLNDSFEDLDLSNGLESQHNSASLSCLPSTSADVNRGNQIQDSNKLARRKRPQQTKLTSFGHLRTVVEAASRVSPKNNKRGSFDSAPKVALPRTSSFESAQHVMEPTLSVDVRIDKKLYRVPVLLAQVTTNTIKWLADEAAARYAKKEYMIPSLELETKNGAILADDDPISLLFPMGATQAEEVEARVVKWSVPPLIDRYRGACQDMSTKPCDRVCQMLQQLTVNLNLCNCGLRGATLAPLCKVLNRQTNLLELDLSGNFLTNECVQLLGASLASLENLHKLRLNCTGLLAEHVQTLVNSLSPDTSHKVTDVDLSDNLLGDQSLEGLALLTRRFQLKKFNLSGNRLGKNLFAHTELTLNLDQVEEFDLSDNDLSNDALVRIVSWLRPSRLRSLDVSRNCASCGFLREMVSSWSRVEQLKVLKLSRCHVNDGDLFDLLRVVDSLERLDLSYNDDVTSVSLRKLLEKNILHLDLYGCGKIFDYFTGSAKYLGSTPDSSRGKSIKVSLPEDGDKEADYMIQMWRELYGGRTVVERTSRFLYIFLRNEAA